MSYIGSVCGAGVHCIEFSSDAQECITLLIEVAQRNSKSYEPNIQEITEDLLECGYFEDGLYSYRVVTQPK